MSIRSIFTSSERVIRVMDKLIKQHTEGRKRPHATANLDLQLQDGFLTVHYSSTTSRCLFDISNMHGKILKTGKINTGETSINIDLRDLKAGTYVLWIVDGSEIIKAPFSLS